MLNSRLFRTAAGVMILAGVVMAMACAFYGFWTMDWIWVSRSAAFVTLLLGAKFLYEVALLVDKYRKVGDLIDDLKKKFGIDIDLDDELEEMFKGYM